MPGSARLVQRYYPRKQITVPLRVFWQNSPARERIVKLYRGRPWSAPIQSGCPPYFSGIKAG